MITIAMTARTTQTPIPAFAPVPRLDAEVCDGLVGGLVGWLVDGLVDEDLAVTDLEVEGAVRVGADPGFVLDGGTLVAEIGEWHEVPHVALLALGEIELGHPLAPFNPPVGVWSVCLPLPPPGVSAV